ncbi:MAG: cytochrome c [Nitrospinae bacterium]|nr:cytochrome c [Nitrospinota bacterium]
MKAILGALAALAISAGPSLAADGADVYNKKCKMCHDMPGSGKTKVGPDIKGTTMTLEQFTKQVSEGSEWVGRTAPRMAGFEKKKMPPVKGLSADEIKAVYEFSKATH